MNIQIKNIKYAAFASQETSCYQATLYYEGKSIGKVSNDGWGGPDMEEPTDNVAWAKMMKEIASMPNTEPCKLFPEGRPQELDCICGELLNVYLIERDLKKLLKNRVMFTRAGHKGIFQTSVAKRTKDWSKDHVLKCWVDEWAHKDDTELVLNNMPFDEAVVLYKARG